MLTKSKKLKMILTTALSIVMLSSNVVFASTSSKVNIDPSKAITVDGGKITGTLSSDKDIAIYKGIPYAAPPVGDLRWKAPQPVKEWSGVKEAVKYSANAVQTLPDYSMPWMATMTSEFEPDESLGYSEDCLYLNVWTKSKSTVKKRPVVVYIHGGGFGSGSTSVPIYDGTALAQKDVVYVSINYRVGIFGFLADPKLAAESKDGLTGNYGILDQIAALKWVNKNIEKFGGDPDNVTIVGQSAGAASVDILTISPYAKGLFKNAFAMSFNYISGNGLAKLNTMEVKEKEDTKLFEGKTLKEMRAMSKEDLLKLQFNNTPVIDGKVIPADVADVLKKGNQNKVNMVTGTVTDDTTLFGVIAIGNPFAPMTSLTKAEFEKGVKEKFGVYAQECLDAYPVIGDDALSQYNQLNSDGIIVNQNYLAKLRSLKSNKDTYVYSFTHGLPGKVNFPAFHSGDIPYWLGTFSPDRSQYLRQVDYDLSKNVMSYLVNFANTGDPNGKGLEKWNAYNGKLSYFHIGDNKFSNEGFDDKKIKFWKHYNDSILGLK
jgi:para-nitrobenzyl esterase